MGCFRRSARKPKSSKKPLGYNVVTTVVNAQVDIIFLHGLTGHREETWTAKGEDEPWPKSLLSKDLPTARIITYGYDADVVNLTRTAGRNTVRQHARNLINDLTALRKDDIGRPIIFVAHSLGGLVCQDALLVSSNPNEEQQRDIVSSTCGIAFFGTPHAGSDLERFATAVLNIVSIVKTPNRKLLGVLRVNSEILANIKNDFLTMVQRRLADRQSSLKPIALHAFIEELDVDYLRRRVVEPESAIIPGYNSDTIHADHMEMTKFHTAADPGYVKVLNRLKIWIGNNDSSIALQYANDLRLKFEALWPGFELAKSEAPASAKQLCELCEIGPSLNWFMNSSEYRYWKQGPESRLWQNGEQGDGKTVIMSYILRSQLQETLLVDEGLYHVSIFCSGNDSEEGVAASIAFQLLQYGGQAKVSRSNFPISNFQLGGGRLDFNRLLWMLLSRLIINSPQVILIIDGIDKLDFPVRSSFLDRFGKLERDVMGSHMRVLISSTNNDGIQNSLSHYSSIDREEERRECLKTLEFQEWNARESGVQEVEAAGTCPQNGREEWIFNNPADKSVIIARFYYSFRGGNMQTSHELMLRSIVYQIWSKNSRLFPLIRHRYRELMGKFKRAIAIDQTSFWSYDDIKWVLKSLRRADFNLRVFIVVDGMDESNNDKRLDILKFLLDFASPNLWSSCIVKIFIASRPENDINSRLRTVTHHVRLQEVNEEDIRMVVGGWIERMVSEYKCKEETLLKVKDYIIGHSDGVFMWVTLVLRDLEQHIDDGGYSKSSLNTRLRSLPKELGGKGGFYRIMVNSLVKKYKENQGQQEQGQQILTWVTFAERPISVTELRDALATPSKLERTDLSTYILEDKRRDGLDRAILSSCGGLVEISDSPSGKIVQLIHQTAREFLLHKDKHAGPYYLEEVKGDMEIAMSCCRYLTIVFRPDFPPAEANAELPQVKIVVDHLSEKPLLVYALVNFQAHLDHLGSDGEKVRDEFMSFVELLIERSNSYASLLLGQWIEALRLPTKLHVDKTSARLYLHSLLQCAAETGNKEVAEVLFSLRSDLLHIVASFPAAKEHEGGLKLLFDMGFDTNSKDMAGRTPMSYAAENGHEGNVQTLFRNRADINSQDTAGRTPLSYAVENGHQDSFDLLVSKGAYVDLRDSAGRTPISYAAENGQMNILSTLLFHNSASAGASTDTAGRTPVSYAAENGHEVILGLLLNTVGVNLDLKDTAGRTPLSYSAENGHEGNVTLLLRNMAITNSKDKAGRTPLSYAAENGHVGSLKLLLENGASSDSDDTGRTPLSYATANSHIAVVKLLQSYITA
ncbi:hypothetical protein V500_00731 [Pseudogymnoascus sp. VKM F-4518 (FW-2643)]|nr:hypothetical protein V500_00731 [Pseudogymnoascus sp. VKM F-4518 (FW-2643)]